MIAQLLIPLVLSGALGAPQIYSEKPKNAGPLVALPDFRPVVKETIDAVVNIAVESKVKMRRGEGQDPGDFFERFFGPGFRVPREFKNRGVGSGFVISPDGYALTNHHVVENATSIKVKFPDEVSTEEFNAKVVGLDPRTDVALIKIEGRRNFPHIPLGDSAALTVGDWVLAIGNPFGLANSVSAGIISAKDRRDIFPSGRAGLYDFIQTDASINPGNSGGPLINMRGEVIGINAAINAAGQGLGFAIPINMVKPVLGELREKGKVTRSWIGIVVQRMDAKLAKSYGLDHAQGAIVADVVEGGPAQKAGVREGDVVLDFDGKPVKDSSDLQFLASQAGVNKTVNVGLWRDGKRNNVKVTLGELPNDDETTLGGGGQREEKGAGALGVRVADLTPELRGRLEVNERSGVVVVEVDPSSAAADADIRRGDVIVKLNGKAIASARAFAEAVKVAKSGEMLRLQVKREGGSLFVALPKP